MREVMRKPPRVVYGIGGEEASPRAPQPSGSQIWIGRHEERCCCHHQILLCDTETGVSETGGARRYWVLLLG